MPIEIEAKMKVAELGSVRRRLAECGGVRAGSHFEVNVFFDTEDRRLLSADKGLRLRRSRNDDTGEESAVITFKGPLGPGPLKSREEVEAAVASFDDAQRLLHALGDVTILSFEKRRESWELAGCKVELDELPHLGFFVEVEGPDEHAVLHARELLRLSDHPLISTGYAALLSRYLEEHRRTERDVTFWHRSSPP